MKQLTTPHADLRAALLALALAATAAIATAQTDGTWTNYSLGANVDANWTLSTNWQDGIVASGTDATATFNGDQGNQLQFKSGSVTIGHITLTDTGGGTDRGMRFDSGFTIDFDTTAGTPSITVSDFAGDIPLQFNGATITGSDGLSLSIANSNNVGARFNASNWSGFSGTLTLAAGRFQTEGANVLPQSSEIAFGSGVHLRIVFNNTRDQSIRGLSGGDATTLVGNQDNSTTLGTLTVGTNSTASDDYTFGGSLGGDGFTAGQANSYLNLVKNGDSTQRFTGANLHAGTTTINAGTLLVNGTHIADTATGTSNGRYDVNSGGVLGGSGLIRPYNTTGGTVMIDIKAGGTLSPGDGGTGTLTLDNSASAASVLNFSAGGLLAMDLGAAGTSDTIAVVASASAIAEVIFNDTVINFTDLTAGGLVAGSYLLFDGDADTQFSGLSLGGAYTGLNSIGGSTIASGLSIGTGLEGYSTTLWQNAEGNKIYVDVAAVPEPATYALLLGVSALGFVAWRRRSGAKR